MTKFTDISVGYRFTNNTGSWFTVKKITSSKNIEIISDTGYVTTTQMIHIRTGQITDKNKRTIFGVGYLGGGCIFGVR